MADGNVCAVMATWIVRLTGPLLLGELWACGRRTHAFLEETGGVQSLIGGQIRTLLEPVC